MTREQRSVTLAWLLVFGSLAAYHHWPSRLVGWVQKTPDSAQQAKAHPENLIPSGDINDWQAAIIAYAVLFAAAATDAAPLATSLAWAISLVLGAGAIETLAKEYPGVFPSGQGGQGSQGGQSAEGAQGG